MLKCLNVQILKVIKDGLFFSDMSGRGHNSWAICALYRPIPIWNERMLQLMQIVGEYAGFLKSRVIPLGPQQHFAGRVCIANQKASTRLKTELEGR